MSQVNVQEAKTHLSRILARVERGESVVVARGGNPVARIVPVAPPTERELGFVRFVLPDSFFEPLDEEQLAAWEG